MMKTESNEGDFERAEMQPRNDKFYDPCRAVLYSINEQRCEELELELMIKKYSLETPFTISVDLIGNGCTTGISTR